MSNIELLVNIKPDKDWRKFEREIKGGPKGEQDCQKLGYVIGRYDLGVDLTETEDGTVVSCPQDLDARELFDGILSLWHNDN